MSLLAIKDVGLLYWVFQEISWKALTAPVSNVTRGNMGEEWGWRGYTHFAHTMTPRDSAPANQPFSTLQERSTRLQWTAHHCKNSHPCKWFHSTKEQRFPHWILFLKSNYFLITNILFKQNNTERQNLKLKVLRWNKLKQVEMKVEVLISNEVEFITWFS